MALYSIGTWDTDLQAYTPQVGLTVPSINVPHATLREAIRQLRRLRPLPYSAHRKRGADGSYEDNDWAVLVERTDGKSETEIMKGWER